MKKIITLLLAMAMLLSLAACGPETPQRTPGASYDASALEDILEGIKADDEANATKKDENNGGETEHTDPTEPEDDPAPDTTPDDGEDTSGIRPEFQATMDEYEAFFDEYVEFMTAYQQADDVLGMMGEYASMMKQYAETMAALEEIDEDELSEEEALYYAEVMLRIEEKLLSVV